MKSTTRVISLLTLACALLSSLAAAPQKLTRTQASELFLALTSAEAGLAPANTIAAADNLLALRPHVEALDKGKAAYQRAARVIVKAAPADAEAQVIALQDQLEAKANEQVAIELVPLNLSDEELTAAKIKPAALAIIRQWLKPAPKK